MHGGSFLKSLGRKGLHSLRVILTNQLYCRQTDKKICYLGAATGIACFEDDKILGSISAYQLDELLNIPIDSASFVDETNNPLQSKQISDLILNDLFPTISRVN